MRNTKTYGFSSKETVVDFITELVEVRFRLSDFR